MAHLHKKENMAASREHKAGTSFCDIHFPKAKISSNVNSQNDRSKVLVKLPEINLRPGTNPNMAKVST